MIQSTLSSAFHSELEGIQKKLQTFFKANQLPDTCFQLLDRLCVEHTQKFRKLISNQKIRTNVLATIQRVTSESNKERAEQPRDKDVFVADGTLYHVKSNCNIEPVISSEHRRFYEIHTMRGKVPTILKPNNSEGLRLIANALMCNRKPKNTLIWIIGENTQSFISNFKTIAGGYAVYVTKTDTKIKTDSGSRIAIIENSRTLQTKLNRIPSTVLPLVVSSPNDFTAPECGSEWLVFKFSPPPGLTPEQVFMDLIQAANPAQTEVISTANCVSSDQLTSDSIENVVKEFIKEHGWTASAPSSPSSDWQKKVVPIKDIKAALSKTAAKKGILVLTQKSIANAFLSNKFAVTNPRNVLSVTYYSLSQVGNQT